MGATSISAHKTNSFISVIPFKHPDVSLNSTELDTWNDVISKIKSMKM